MTARPVALVGHGESAGGPEADDQKQHEGGGDALASHTLSGSGAAGAAILGLDHGSVSLRTNSRARYLPPMAFLELDPALARLLGSIPEHRLEQLMRTPLRRVVLDGVFWGIPRWLNDTRAGEVITAIRCHITGRPDGTFDMFWLEFRDGTWQSGRGTLESEPELTITVDGAQLLELALRRSTPLQAYLSGRLRASGNPLLAARLTTLLRGFGSPSGPTNPPA